MVGDPGIEPGMGLPGGVTVRCRTLQHVARREGVIRPMVRLSQQKFTLQRATEQAKHRFRHVGTWNMKKPRWVIEKELAKKAAAAETIWLFGLHAVRDALLNPRRSRQRLIVTRNAADRLSEAISKAGITPEIADPRRFPAPLDPGSVHQGAALEVKPLSWGSLEEICRVDDQSIVVILDRITDPHNVGAIMRSAAAFDARAVVATLRHSPPETGALAKAASGALERLPYLRIRNLAEAMETLRTMGYALLGLEGEATSGLADGLTQTSGRPIGLVLGAEGAGLRSRTRESCDRLVRIGISTEAGSLNVSNAAAVALYAARNEIA